METEASPHRKRAYDVAVVGAGIMGLAIAHHMARKGRAVVVLEQFDVMHNRGSSHGESRIFRLAYDDPAYVRLARMARPLWSELEAESKQTLLTTTGALDFGPREILGPIAEALRAEGMPFEESPAEAARLAAFVIPGQWGALFQPDAGVILANKARSALLNMSRARGVRFMEHCEALGVDLGENHAALRYRHGTVNAEHVVIAAAGWANTLLRPLGWSVPLKVTREHVGYFPTDHPQAFVPFIWHDPTLSHEMYGLPNGERPEIKIGQHGAGQDVSPDSEPELDLARLSAVSSFVQTRMRGVGPEMAGAETCLYASTPDDDFVVDRLGPVVVAMGFGGHGFKFAPAIAELVGDVLDGQSPPEKFGYHRFAPTTAPAG